MAHWRPDPGPCPICGTAHTACTADRGPILIPQLPARDALAAATTSVEASPEPPASPPARTFTTKDYRGKKAK